MKSYQTPYQLENKKGMLFHVFNAMFTRKTQGDSSNLFVLCPNFPTLSLGHLALFEFFRLLLL